MRGEESFRFDLLTQRFICGRWESTVGGGVLNEIVDAIEGSIEIRGLLDRYVLVHEQNSDPYAYPYYPPDAMAPDRFWVLTHDDLRGASFVHEKFAGSHALGKKSLEYASFYECDLEGANLEMTQLSFARFEKCNLRGALIAKAAGIATRFIDCDLTGVCLADTALSEADFSDSDLRGVYFERTRLKNVRVNRRTMIDERLRSSWKGKSMSPAGRPDIVRAFRIAYEGSEVWEMAGRFLYRERIEARQQISWPRMCEQRDAQSFGRWFGDLVAGAATGYGTKPGRLIATGVVITLAFTWLYWTAGSPDPQAGTRESAFEALYFSLTTFATLGLGDVTYPAERPWMRLLTATEAWIGAVTLAAFVAVLARKLFR